MLSRHVFVILIVLLTHQASLVQGDDNPRLKFHAEPRALPHGAVTHDWTRFLGPTYNAVSTETKLLKQWSNDDGPKLVWELRKGTGYTSPAIQGKHLVFVHRMGDDELVECLHPETGEPYWSHKYPTQYRDRIGYNNGPRSSPVIDDDRVYTLGAEGKLYCLHLATGKVLWKRDLIREFDPMPTWFGYGTTPLVYGKHLIINVGAPEHKNGAAVVAFDKLSGEVVWQCGDQWGQSYASPIPAKVHGRERLFVFTGGEKKPPRGAMGPGGLLMVDPAKGKVEARYPWRSTMWQSVNATTPLVLNNQVYISATYELGAAMLNVTQNNAFEVQWKNREFDMHWNQVFHKDGYLYGFAGRNEPDASLVCHELKTGKQIWSESITWTLKRKTKGVERTMRISPYRASMLHVDGHFLCLGELGTLMWLDLTPQGHKIISRTWLFAATETWGTPVLSRGLLYITQNSVDRLNDAPPRLLCYDLRGK